MSNPHDDDEDKASRAAGSRIKHGIKPGKSGDGEDDDSDKDQEKSGRNFGGLNIGPRPPAPGSPKPPTPAPKPPTPAASAPKPTAPKPPTPAASAPKPPTPRPPVATGGATLKEPLPGPSSAATPAAGGLRVGATAYVRKAGGMNLRLRSAPGLESTVLASLPPGTQMTLLGGPRRDDGYDWWQIRTVDGREGFVAGSELVTERED